MLVDSQLNQHTVLWKLVYDVRQHFGHTAIQSIFISTRGELIASRDDLHAVTAHTVLFILDAIKSVYFNQ